MKFLVLLALCLSCSTDDSQECSNVGEKITSTGTQCVATVPVTENGVRTERCTQYQKYTDTYVCGSDHRWYLEKREPQQQGRTYERR